MKNKKNPSFTLGFFQVIKNDNFVSYVILSIKYPQQHSLP